jgi:hypothetical protein
MDTWIRCASRFLFCDGCVLSISLLAWIFLAFWSIDLLCSICACASICSPWRLVNCIVLRCTVPDGQHHEARCCNLCLLRVHDKAVKLKHSFASHRTRLRLPQFYTHITRHEIIVRIPLNARYDHAKSSLLFSRTTWCAKSSPSTTACRFLTQPS